MSIPISIKQQGCEGLWHFYLKRTLGRELKVPNESHTDSTLFKIPENWVDLFLGRIHLSSAQTLVLWRHYLCSFPYETFFE